MVFTMIKTKLIDLLCLFPAPYFFILELFMIHFEMILTDLIL